jgi:hypothetical protein
VSEVVALEEQRLTPRHCQRVGEAVAEVEASWGSRAPSITPMTAPCHGQLALVERHDLGAGLGEQFVQLRSATLTQNNRRLEDGGR